MTPIVAIVLAVLGAWAGVHALRKAVAEQSQAAADLHAQFRHPGWEYATTEGPRKAWDAADVPPEGEGWERNLDAGYDGWIPLDYTEESYWRRQEAGARSDRDNRDHP